MGTIKLKLVISLLVFLISTISVLLIFGDYSNPRRFLFYRYHTKLDFGYVLGFLPKKYHENYSESLIEESKNFSLFNIIYKQFPSKNHNYLILKEKDKFNSEEILFDSDSMFWYVEGNTNLLSSQFRISPFKKYLKYKGISEERKIVEEFCKILSDFNKQNYQIISNSDDLFSLRKIEVKGREECYAFLQENFSPNFHLNTYCWFKGIGLFEISLSFQDQELTSITDYLIFGKIASNVETVECNGNVYL